MKLKQINSIILIICHFTLLKVFSHTPIVGKNGMVVSSCPLASQVGIDILKQGGNAVDAAVAVGFVLAVTYPQAGNIGGGGFMLIRLADGTTAAIDYRETAPLRATPDMYLDAEGNIIPDLSLRGPQAAGVPGTVAGLTLALERYGSMDLKTILKPAIKLAKNGFQVNFGMSQDFYNLKEDFKKYPSTAKLFLKNGIPYQMGDILRQLDLAKTLEQIAKNGADAFYRGPIAKLIDRAMKRDGGLISLEDLTLYQPVIREPLVNSYRDFTIYTMPPPTSGGIILCGILNAMEPDNLQAIGHNSATYIHQFVEICNHYYADRAFFMGDPDFTNIPIPGLLSKEYALKIRQSIDPERHIPSQYISHGDSLWLATYPSQPPEPDNTTHFSVVDRWGNAVSNTYTLNDSYGSYYVVEGAGFLLNNEMDDFSIKPGAPNIYGLLGDKANSIQPCKRMLSSMTPTIITKGGNLFLVLGSPGGSKIITSVTQVVLNVIDHHMNVQDAVLAPRVHSQWMPDEVVIEPLGISADVVTLLQMKGHNVRTGYYMGEVQAIMVDPERGLLFGAIDLRYGNSAVACY